MTSGGRLALAAALFCALLAGPAQALEAPDQRDPRHHIDGPPDTSLYDFKPALFPAGLPPIAPRGPATAKGIVIWNHGRDANATATPIAPPAAWELARSGWDVYSQHRLGTHDVTQVTLRIIGAGVDRAKALGYRRVVLMGQSAGGFMGLGEATRRSDVSAVIALAPAAFGTPGSPMDWRRNDSGLREIWTKLQGKRIALAVAFFADDPFFEKSEPAIRGPHARQRLKELGLPALVLDRPAPELFHGHAAGLTLPFARRFSPCLVLLLEQDAPPPCEDGDRGAIATFGLAPPPPVASAAPGDLFAGLWQGTSANGRYLLLQLGPPAAGQQRGGSYGIGRSLNNEAASNQSLSFTAEGNRLRWAQGSVSLDVTREADGRLKLRRQAPNETPSESWLQKLN